MGIDRMEKRTPSKLSWKSTWQLIGLSLEEFRVLARTLGASLKYDVGLKV